MAEQALAQESGDETIGKGNWSARRRHPDHAVAFWSARHRRLVGDHLHALRGDIAVRVAIDTTGMEEHPAGF